MKVLDILNFLNQKYNFKSAMPYDNVGLLVGSENAEVTGIVTCLDCTPEAVNAAMENGANLIVSHHPVIFDPLKSVTENSLVYSLIKAGISVISAHTNLDQSKGGVNDTLCNQIGLINVKEVADTEGFLYRIGELSKPLSSADFANLVSKNLNYPVKYVGENEALKTVAVCSGSGSGLFNEVLEQGVSAFVSADIKHSVFMAAHKANITVLDAGHFGTEDVIVEVLAEELKKEFKTLNVIENHYSPIKFIK